MTRSWTAKGARVTIALSLLLVALPSQAEGTPGTGHSSHPPSAFPSFGTRAPLWSATNAAYYPGASSLAVSPSGTTVFVTGTAGGLPNLNFGTVAYRVSTGKELWTAIYDGPNHGTDYAYAIAVNPDGTRVFVTGMQAGTGPFDPDYATVAYDAITGAQLWAASYNGPGNDYDVANAVSVSPDGSQVFVTGRSAGALSTDYATIAYDASSGAQLWLSRYDWPGSGIDIASAIRVSPDGSRVFVTGESCEGCPGLDNYGTVAYDASTGARLWTASYNGPTNGQDYATSIALSPDGRRVFVTGDAFGTGFGTVSFDAATGTQLWATTFTGGGSYSNALGVSPDGTRVFVTGSQATLAYDASTGGQEWLAQFPLKWGFVGLALGVDSSGERVYVTGCVIAHLVCDYLTAAFDAGTGAGKWKARASGLANLDDTPTALGLTPNGDLVFVTGSTERPGGGLNVNYWTLAYKA